jgi:hypothetical protein
MVKRVYMVETRLISMLESVLNEEADWRVPDGSD